VHPTQPPTKIERFLSEHRIKPAELARECGCEEMPDDERDAFEEHYVACTECAAYVTA